MVSASSSKKPIITLTTDFGLNDYFVGVLKGVLLQTVPDAALIDITHHIPRHDLISGAFVIYEAYSYFPPGTVHLIVIDPSVGTARRKIIATNKGHYFIAPDNGVLTYLLKEKGCRVFEVFENPSFLKKESPTFAGRDHFAPITTALALGESPKDLGKEIFDARQIPELCHENFEGKQCGKIVYFDHFGNAISNLRIGDLKGKSNEPILFSIDLNGRKLSGLKKSYTEVREKEVGMLINSSGYLEIFSNRNSAKKILKLNLMDRVIIS